MYMYRLFVPYLPALVLAAMPRSMGQGNAIAAACLALQAALAYFVYERSENPTLALLVARDETFEFANLGARYTATFLDAAASQASAIAAHWRDHGGQQRPVRMFVDTGGIVPYQLADAYVLEALASYRHRCRPDLVAMADYEQAIYTAEEAAAVRARHAASGQSLVARETIVADGLRAQPLVVTIDIWHQPHPAPFTLPARIDEPCLTASPPSPPRK